MRISTYQEYIRPTVDEAYILDGVNLETLDHEELLQISDGSYCIKNWTRLIYSLTNQSLRVYSDIYVSELIEKMQVINDSPDDIKGTLQSSIKSLVFNTNLQSPLYDVSEVKFFSGTDLFGGLGIYIIQSKLGFNEEMIQMVVTRVIQYSLESFNPFKGLSMVVVQPNGNWKMVMVQIRIPKYDLRINNNTVTAQIHVFDPDRFVRMILEGINPKEAEHVEFKSIFKVAGSLEHFK